MLRANEQVPWIETGDIVASVADDERRFQVISQIAVRRNAVYVFVTAAIEHLPIPFATLPSGPIPTSGYGIVAVVRDKRYSLCAHGSPEYKVIRRTCGRTF